MTALILPAKLRRNAARAKTRYGSNKPDPKWRTPKAVSIYAVVMSVYPTLLSTLGVLSMPSPFMLANFVYSWWTAAMGMRNVRRTFLSAKLDAKNRELPQGEPQYTTDLTPAQSMVNSFNIISHCLFAGASHQVSMMNTGLFSSEVQISQAASVGGKVICGAASRGIAIYIKNKTRPPGL